MLLTFITLMYSLAVVSILVITLKKSLRSKTIEESITIWFLFGFAANLLSSAAYYATLPIIGVSSVLAFFLISLTVLLISFICALVYSLTGISSFYFKKKPLTQLFIISFTFFFLEILRSYAVTLLLWGGGSSFGAHMSSYTFGEILANTPLVSFAYFGGVFALSAVLVFCIGIFLYPIKRILQIGLLTLVLIVAVLIKLYPTSTVDIKPVTVGIVQTSFPRVDTNEDSGTVFKKRKAIILPLLLSIASSSPDIVVFPEDSRFITSQSIEELKELQRIFPNTLFVDGTTRLISGGRKNTSIFFDSKTGERALRDKGFLFPFGEYVPYIFQPAIYLFSGTKLLSAYQNKHEYIAGVLPEGKQTRFGKIGILICSEISSFTSIRSLNKTNPDIVFLQSSLSWGHNNPYIIMQHIFSIKILANMLRKPIISVANNGPSMVVNSQGKVLFFKESSLTATVFKVEGDNIYKIK